MAYIFTSQLQGSWLALNPANISLIKGRGEDKYMSQYLSAVLPWIRGSRRDSGLAFVLEVGTAAVMLAFEGLVRRMT